MMNASSGSCQIDYEGELNPSQYEAVSIIDGPVLVIAGAGTGKTRTLVYRVARLIELGISPENILLLTFTRKSAQEMLYRASLLLDASCQRVTGGTFHSCANILLRQYGHHLGFAANFTILDRGDSEGILKLLKTSLNLDGVGKRFPSKRVIANVFSRAVNKSETLEDVVNGQYEHLISYLPDFYRILSHYKKFKQENNLMDYDDLLVYWCRLVKEYPNVAELLSNRYGYILVDEYQDTNQIQAEIIRLMARTHDNVMAVGDDAQSIYSFRGADFRNIMNFPKLFPGAEVVKLEENYRSTTPILDLSNAIIAPARERYTKNLFSRLEGNVKPVLFCARNEVEQARYVVKSVYRLQQEGVDLKDIAVLFRSGFHSYQLELELGRNHLDFEKRGGLKLTESAHIKDVLSYLRLSINPLDFLSWNRILLLLPKIGPKTATTIIETIRRAAEPVEALKAYKASGAAAGNLQALGELLQRLRQGGAPKVCFEHVLAYYNDIFERVYHDDFPRRRVDLDQIGEIIGGYDNLEAFLDDAALDPPDSPPAGSCGGDSGGRLILSTIHSAKGLEWHTVFILHLAEGRFPSMRNMPADQYEEERRLLYVAATRAKTNLYLLFPREYSAEGKYHFAAMSPLLSDIPPGLTSGPGSLSVHGGSDLPTPKVIRKQAPNDQLEVGVRVNHDFFGQGRISRCVDPRTVEIFFNRYGVKRLRLDYAKLEIIESE